MNYTHLFSIYVRNLSSLIKNTKEQQAFVFYDKDLHKRLTRVLRLKSEEHVVLFDKQIHVKCCLQAKTFEQNKQVFVSIVSIAKNELLKPEIVLSPSLLKKSSFEDVCYMAAAMGANMICPILSEKIKRSWGGDKERDRLEKIIIAACEQAKNFSVPELHEPILLKDYVKTLDTKTEKIIFDVSGDPLLELLNSLHNNTIKKIGLLFGPEGGFTEKELDLVMKSGFACHKLTPTVLRAVEAVAVGLGSVRSVGL